MNNNEVKNELPNLLYIKINYNNQNKLERKKEKNNIEKLQYQRKKKL